MNSSYSFATNKLLPVSSVDEESTLVALVLCGSFNPIHNAHIHLYSAAKRIVREQRPGFTIVGGFISPVSDGYGKPGLKPISVRATIASAALSTHPELALDLWEGLQPQYTRTLFVLEHLREELKAHYASRRRDVKVMLVCGADLFLSFAKPHCWPLKFLKPLLTQFPICVIGRSNIDSVDAFRSVYDTAELTEEATDDTPEVTLKLSEGDILFGLFETPDDTNSTGIRDVIATVKQQFPGDTAAANEAAAEKLQSMVPEAAVALVVNAYFDSS